MVLLPGREKHQDVLFRIQRALGLAQHIRVERIAVDVDDARAGYLHQPKQRIQQHEDARRDIDRDDPAGPGLVDDVLDVEDIGRRDVQRLPEPGRAVMQAQFDIGRLRIGSGPFVEMQRFDTGPDPVGDADPRRRQRLPPPARAMRDAELAAQMEIDRLYAGELLADDLEIGLVITPDAPLHLLERDIVVVPPWN